MREWEATSRIRSDHAICSVGTRDHDKGKKTTGASKIYDEKKKRKGRRDTIFGSRKLCQSTKKAKIIKNTKKYKNPKKSKKIQ